MINARTICPKINRQLGESPEGRTTLTVNEVPMCFLWCLSGESIAHGCAHHSLQAQPPVGRESGLRGLCLNTCIEVSYVNERFFRQP